MIKNKKNKGFTLIELMVVISIIALLSSIVLATITDARNRSISTKFKSEVRSFVSALELYRTSLGSYPYQGGALGSTFTSTVSNSNVTTVQPVGTNPSLATLMLPFLKTLPTVPVNSNTAANPAWMYVSNHLTSGTRYRCVGDVGLPAYVILISNQNPFLFSAFSDLPFHEISPAGPLIWGGSLGTDRCLSLK